MMGQSTSLLDLHKENTMNPRNTILILMTLVACGGAVSFGATISGTVKGPEGAALEGVFVQAQNKKINTTFMVLSDNHGHYRMEKLPAGTTSYRPKSRATLATRSPA